MKWRDRISILSRKRSHSRPITPVTELNVQSSVVSGSQARVPSPAVPAATRAQVQTTLAQVRPVIGPDHKSYYILLRGTEDSFMCIQPSKERVHSLDEVVKNVVTSVKSCSHTPPKRPKSVLTRTYSSTVSHKQRPNGVHHAVHASSSTASPPHVPLPVTASVSTSVSTSTSSLIRGGSCEKVLEEVTMNVYPGTTHLPNIKDECKIKDECDTKDECDLWEEEEEDSSLVENVIINQTMQSLSDNSQEVLVLRTSTPTYPLVNGTMINSRGSGSTKEGRGQRHTGNPRQLLPYDLDSKATLDSILENLPLLENKSAGTSDGDSLGGCTSEDIAQFLQEEGHRKVKTVSQSVNPIIKSEKCGQEKNKVGKGMGPPLLGAGAPHTQLCLMAREGTVLTEEEITAQIRSLIESDQLVVEGKDQIVVMRLSAREAMIKVILHNKEVAEEGQRTSGGTQHTRQAVESKSQQQNFMNENPLHMKETLQVKDDTVNKNNLYMKEEAYNVRKKATDMEEDKYMIRQEGLPVKEDLFHPRGEAYNSKESEEEVACTEPSTLEALYHAGLVSCGKTDDRDLDCFFPPYSQLKQELMGDKEGLQAAGELAAAAAESSGQLMESLVSPLVHPLTEVEQDAALQSSVLEGLRQEQLASLEEAILERGVDQDIVVFQRHDGTIVNQDGTPISSELQYLITSSQQEGGAGLELLS